MLRLSLLAGCGALFASGCAHVPTHDLVRAPTFEARLKAAYPTADFYALLTDTAGSDGEEEDAYSDTPRLDPWLEAFKDAMGQIGVWPATFTDTEALKQAFSENGLPVPPYDPSPCPGQNISLGELQEWARRSFYPDSPLLVFLYAQDGTYPAWYRHQCQGPCPSAPFSDDYAQKERLWDHLALRPQYFASYLLAQRMTRLLLDADRDNYALFDKGLSWKDYWQDRWGQNQNRINVGRGLDFSPLPDMLSLEEPVDVAVSSDYDADAAGPGAGQGSSPAASGNLVQISVTAGTPGQLTGTPISVNVVESSAATPTASPDASPTPDDTDRDIGANTSIQTFSSSQNVTLTTFSALNSAETNDRIAYLNTYIYIPPFPYPANGSVDLEQEFWDHFLQYYSLNGYRPDGSPKNDAYTAQRDLALAHDAMRVQIADASSLINAQNLSMETSGYLTNTAAGPGGSLSLGGGGGGLTAAGSVSWGASTSTFSGAIQTQLENRSLYVGEDRDYLRITQRGLQTVNLAGVLDTSLNLTIPAASETIPVVLPYITDTAGAGGTDALTPSTKTKSSRLEGFFARLFCPGNTRTGRRSRPDSQGDTVVGFTLAEAAQPLYDSVDALSFSVVVARRAEDLPSTLDNTYNQEAGDQGDAEYVVGVSHPEHFILWRWKRTTTQLQYEDLFPNDYYRYLKTRGSCPYRSSCPPDTLWKTKVLVMRSGPPAPPYLSPLTVGTGGLGDPWKRVQSFAAQIGALILDDPPRKSEAASRLSVQCLGKAPQAWYENRPLAWAAGGYRVYEIADTHNHNSFRLCVPKALLDYLKCRKRRAAHPQTSPTPTAAPAGTGPIGHTGAQLRSMRTARGRAPNPAAS